MEEEELLYLIALKKAEMIGDITAKKLIKYFGTAKNVFAQPKHLIEKVPGVGDKISAQIANPQWLHEAEKELYFCRKSDIKIVTYYDPDYPIHLKKCADSPVVFFQKGNIDFSERRMLAIVGTRNATSYGKNFVDELIEGLSNYPVVIVSGYAYGIDIHAHKAAIRHHLQTVACLAHGLNMTYPTSHAEYNLSMMANGGFITDYGFLSPFDRKNFLSRNRIIAGLAEVTVVAESSSKGGSLVTAGQAVEYNRPVFAVPGRMGDYNTAGCNTLIHDQKAHLILSAEQLIADLKWNKPKQQEAVQQELFAVLTPEEEKVQQYLSKNGKQSLDDLSISCQIPVNLLSGILFNLELKGAIRSLPGKIFESY